jgi:hypothetical protein
MWGAAKRQLNPAGPSYRTHLMWWNESVTILNREKLLGAGLIVRD